MQTSPVHQRKLYRNRSDHQLIHNVRAAASLPGSLYDRALSQTPLDSHEILWTLVYFLIDTYFSACKITSPVISFAGTVPSTHQLYSPSLSGYVLKKSLTKILLVTENSPPPLYISSLHLSSITRRGRSGLPLSNRHFICQDPESRISNAHDT